MSHKKIEKTNSARLLDRAKIAYELVPYIVDEEHLAATHVAEQLNEPIELVFKTLVLKAIAQAISSASFRAITRSTSRLQPASRVTKKRI